LSTTLLTGMAGISLHVAMVTDFLFYSHKAGNLTPDFKKIIIMRNYLCLGHKSPDSRQGNIFLFAIFYSQRCSLVRKHGIWPHIHNFKGPTTFQKSYFSSSLSSERKHGFHFVSMYVVCTRKE
jgi:hypothetical protein